MSEDLKTQKELLYKTILSLKSEEECEAFFGDLCTYKEIDSMAQRLSAAKMLIAGETYEQIIAATDISSATLSRVSRCVKHGSGYVSVLKKD